MHKDSILVYNLTHGFGEIFWITCPTCWNAMRTVRWEDGDYDEYCAICERRDLESMWQSMMDSINKN
jgi:hypothetical protein